MASSPWRLWAWLLAWAVAGLAGAAWIGHAALQQAREAFTTDARIVHRLLSQQAVQHDAVLATLALLQPTQSAAGEPEWGARLRHLYPQISQVRFRRPGATAWPVDDAQGLMAAEARSRQLQRAALATLDLREGRYWLVLAAGTAAYALQFDMRAMVPRTEWPLPANSPVQVELQLDGQAYALQPTTPAYAGRAWVFHFSKHLASASQPFEVVARRVFSATELPWARMAAWLVACALLLAGLAALQRLRTARRRAEELVRLGQVARLNALGELAAGLAHELNQPLTAVTANTQAARRLLDDDPPELGTAREAMGRAVEQARRAAEVLGRLRRSIERPGSAERAGPVKLHEAVHNVLDLLAPECRRRGVAPRVSGLEGLRVQADAVALEQILHNLVMNALQALEAAPPGARRLDLQGHAAGTLAPGLVVLAVRDSGPGVAPDAARRIFEPFFTTREGGLGLGLSLCETLATGMGGQLTLHTQASKGAEFRLALPPA